MKKTIVVALVFMMVVTMLTACGGQQNENATESPSETATESVEPGTEGPAVTAGAVRTGLGQVITISKSASATAEANALGQIDAIMAAVTIDSAGKIVNVKIDNAQIKVNFDAAGQLVTDTSAAVATKVELGDNYGMKKASSIGKEWYEQIAVLEDWMVGKTIDEVLALKTYQKDDSHPAVPEDADLTSSVTISVQDYLQAVKEAVDNAKAFDVEVSGATKTGLGSVVSIANSKSATADAEALAQADIVMAAVTVDEAGKIVGVVIDNGQVKINFDAKGTLITDASTEPRTKVELGDEYGMKKASSIGKEWYEQIAALGNWMIGKTIDEVKAIKTYQKDGTNTGVPEEADLTSSVTISVTDFIEAVSKAIANAD